MLFGWNTEPIILFELKAHNTPTFTSWSGTSFIIRGIPAL
jgi:hypothetical protein